MDLIYTDPSKIEMGVLHEFELDHESSTDPSKNTYEIKHPLENGTMDFNGYWYIDGTEYGGKVDEIKIDTEQDLVYYSGRTWRGILNTKIIEPPAGDDYYYMNGDMHAVMSAVLRMTGLKSLFSVSAETVRRVSYRVPRYVSVFVAFTRMLAKYKYKLVCRWANGMVKLTAEPIKDWSNDTEITSDLFDFVLKKNVAAPNHVIGLGKGELRNRLVIHRFLAPDGSISDTQYYFGLNEITRTYEDSDEEDPIELTNKVDDKLEEWMVEDSLAVTANDIEADIGDIFTAVSEKVGLSVRQYVTGKIANISDDDIQIRYEVGASLY